MTALLASVLVASVLGSLHCAAMCGGIVCAVSVPGRALASQAAWHAGRGAAYLLLGLAAGLAGKGLEHVLAPWGLGRVAAVLAGVLLVVWGLGSLAASLGWRRASPASVSPFARPLSGALRAVRDWPPLGRGLAMGSLTALLPCGWLWAFVASAAGTGAPLRGVLVMGTFWIGTLPLLAALGFAAGRALAPLRQRLPVLTASAMVVVGLLTVAGRFQPYGMDHGAQHSHGAAPASAGAHEHHGGR